MTIDFTDMDRATREFVKKFYEGQADRIMGVDVAGDVDYTVAYVTSDSMHFTEIASIPANKDESVLGKKRRLRRPLGVGDLAELLGGYEWSRQLDVLAYMKHFRTWDALYDDLDRREREAVTSPMRNVTPEKPKQLRENNG